LEVVSDIHEEKFQNEGQQWKDPLPKPCNEPLAVGILVLQEGGRIKKELLHIEIIMYMKLFSHNKYICIYKRCQTILAADLN